MIDPRICGGLFVYLCMQFKQFYKNLKAFRVFDTTSKIVATNNTKVLDLQRAQLLRGEGVDGKTLTPRISQDPYFKSPESAKKYADWKHKLYPETPYDVPNLIITGVYHGSLSLSVTLTRVSYAGSASFSDKIRAKYQDKQLGLNDKSLDTAWLKVVKPDFTKEFKDKVGGK